MTKTLSVLTAAGAVMLAAHDAGAQHARFVLFGDPDPAAAALGPETHAVHPITSPFFHENSFITSDVRAWFLFHDLPNDSLIDGGEAYAVAVQVRLALTSSLQFVAYKDGYLWLESGLVEENGWFDIGAGLKWAFWQDFSKQFHMAVGAGYEIASGTERVLQDDDEIRVWGSIDKGFDKWHLGGTLNFFFPVGSEDDLGDSYTMSWHLRTDYRLTDWFSPVIEFNGYHVLQAGDSPLPFQGIDIGNFGNGEDDPVVTIGLGGEFRPATDLGLRVGFELPLTDNEDLYGWRVTASIVFSF